MNNAGVPTPSKPRIAPINLPNVSMNHEKKDKLRFTTERKDRTKKFLLSALTLEGSAEISEIEPEI